MYNSAKRKTDYAIAKMKRDSKCEWAIAENLYAALCSVAGNGGNFSRVEIEGDNEFFLEDTTIIGYFSSEQIERCLEKVSNLEPDFGRAYCVLARRGSKTAKRNAKYIFNFRSGDRFKEMLVKNIKPCHILKANKQCLNNHF